MRHNHQKTKVMKKLFFTLFLCAAMCPAQAQWMDNIIAQPTHVVGKRINASGEVTSTLESDFTYDENGRPLKAYRSAVQVVDENQN